MALIKKRSLSDTLLELPQTTDSELLQENHIFEPEYHQGFMSTHVEMRLKSSERWP